MIKEIKGQVLGEIEITSPGDEKMRILLNPCDAQAGVYLSKGDGWKYIGRVVDDGKGRREHIKNARTIARCFDSTGCVQVAYIDEPQNGD